MVAAVYTYLYPYRTFALVMNSIALYFLGVFIERILGIFDLFLSIYLPGWLGHFRVFF